MKVTVLVAVYNASSYLSVCMDSLLGQTHADIEIICIDDASTDDSWAILQQYAARDTRVVLLRQTVNGGQAKARNRGLTVATGDFITMVDSDDWLAPDAIEAIQQIMMNEELPANVRLSAAKDVLDRAGYAAPKQVNVSNTTLNLTGDDLEGLKAIALQRAQANGMVIDVSPDREGSEEEN